MTRFLLAPLPLLLALAAPAAAQSLDYAHQADWKPAHGGFQSPIDIVPAQAHDADPDESQAIRLRHTRSELEVVDNGHAIEVEVHGPDSIIRGRHFKLAQFHFHAQSEHTLDGKHFPVEGHFVFKADDGRLAVVAVMYREGAANPLAARLLAALGDGDRGHLPETDIAAMLPREHGYFHYLGSLTTPPLTENVEWYVLETPMTLSAGQLAAFAARYGHNNRDVQPLSGRLLTRSHG